MNDKAGKPSIFDGAGEIEQMTSDEVLLNHHAQVKDKQALEGLAQQEGVTMTVDKDGNQKMHIDYDKYMHQFVTKTLVREHTKVGRNDPCPCGSGKKYKNCCLDSGKYEGRKTV